ncbi:XapX domain-containing protein [Allomesorhizobium alhagi]|jgi:XapX domain-containing protein|uniref:XapX domain-containing protein n=1 Tax=Mesorhizobium alhagi CCNWXJ12-2 TaxID=1107882 RepID=H0HUD5_9HYPH|nr:XapX domain-containing protein [Mesorhizobium alhagi]EHK55665.1 XapX domain-containing protein [Mesorhizobium alhagi CCNWXJ12-2]
MKLYLISLGVGVLVGVIYALLNVRSPAPPIVALVGLLGILIGEQVVPVAKRLLSGEPVNTSWLSSECAPHMLGELPSGPRSSPQRTEAPT